MMADNTQKAKQMPLSFWINLVLSFVFVFVGVTFVSGIAFLKFARDWVGEQSAPTVGWIILTIGVFLGLFNVFRYCASKESK